MNTVWICQAGQDVLGVSRSQAGAQRYARDHERKEGRNPDRLVWEPAELGAPMFIVTCVPDGPVYTVRGWAVTP